MSSIDPATLAQIQGMGGPQAMLAPQQENPDQNAGLAALLASIKAIPGQSQPTPPPAPQPAPNQNLLPPIPPQAPAGPPQQPPGAVRDGSWVSDASSAPDDPQALADQQIAFI